MPNRYHMMLDIETLATDSKATGLSVGAILFRPRIAGDMMTSPWLIKVLWTAVYESRIELLFWRLIEHIQKESS